MEQYSVVFENDFEILDLFGEEMLKFFKGQILQEIKKNQSSPYMVSVDRPTHSCALEVFTLLSCFKSGENSYTSCYKYAFGVS